MPSKKIKLAPGVYAIQRSDNGASLRRNTVPLIKAKSVSIAESIACTKVDKRLALEDISPGAIGHGVLDAVGFVPGAGEVADVANAVWYASEGKYFDAAMSLISVIPEVGDVVGKGIRYFGKLSEHAMVKEFGPVIVKYWPQARNLAEKSPKLAKYLGKLDEAVRKAIPAAEKMAVRSARRI